MMPAMAPGFGKPLTAYDLERSRDVYNSLPHIDTRFGQPVDRDSVKKLLEIIMRHRLDHIFAVHNLHRHDPLPAGTVRLEKHIDNVLPNARLTPAAPVAELDLAKLHALTYVVDDNELVPIEFGEGANPAPADAIDPQFVAEFTGHIKERGLTNLFALEFGDFTIKPRQRFTEIEIDEVGTLVAPSAFFTMGGLTTETSWDARGYNPKNSDNDGSTHHEPVANKNTHKVFTNKLDKSPKAVIKSLVEQGFIKAPTCDSVDI